MDEHTLKVLEFAKIRQFLSQRASSPLGAELALELHPSRSTETVRERLGETSEMRDLCANGGFALEGIRDFREALGKAEVAGGLLSPREFLDIGSSLAAVRSIQVALERRGQKLRFLRRHSEKLVPLPHIESEIKRIFDPSGEILDRASIRLRSIRAQLQVTRSKVQEKLNSILSSSDAHTWLQDRVVTVREGRYVVPVREQGKDRIRGIVHDRSATGQTLFIEPLVTVELNNRVRELLLEEQAEIQRILLALTDVVRSQLPALWQNAQVLGALDLVYAKAHLSQDLDAAEPALNTEGRIKIILGYHPLLLLTGASGQSSSSVRPVPLDIELGGTFTTLVVTGPNTGGKTVALKTVGLLVLMAQAGLHIPASPDSEIFAFERVFADIGDEQSIEQSLSTFSSHLQQIIRILCEADPSSLVLLDELGAGTDPQEGSALAMAVLEHLTNANVRTIATTHIGSLKLFAHVHSGMQNASMEFDRASLSPTFQLRMGIPGSSNAFEIAQRLGAPLGIIDRARQFMDSRELKVSELLQDLEEGIRQAEQKTLLAEKGAQEAAFVQEEYERRLEHLHEEERTLRRRAAEEARRRLDEARALADELVREIRATQAGEATVRRAKHVLAEKLSELQADAQPVPRAPSGGQVLQNPEPGQTVWIEELHSKGRLLSEPDEQGMVQVQAGTFRLRLPLSSLRTCQTEETSPAPPPIECPEIGPIPLELHLRGLTGDEAVARLSRYVDDATLGGLSVLRVVHGKGTGALKKRVEEALRRDPRVKTFYPAEWNEGGSGVTVVELK